jgi:hypothetical protein
MSVSIVTRFETTISEIRRPLSAQASVGAWRAAAAAVHPRL